jgi:hypothetical protein
LQSESRLFGAPESTFCIAAGRVQPI